MKSLLLLVTTLFLLQNLTAQINTKYNKAIYVEVGGLGYNTSLNYDMRFIKGKKGGLGFRLGAGYTQVKTNGLLGQNLFQRTTLPVELNYLINLHNHKHFAEMGIAYIPHHIKDTYSDKPVYNSNNWLNLMGGTIGYRFQKENGLFVRVSYNHLATYNSLNSSTTQWSFKPFAGVALGYAF